MGKPRHPLSKWLTRHVAYPAQAALVYGAATLFRLLPVDRASALGGRLGCAIGPRLRGHRIARRNLVAAFPDKSGTEIDAILHGMWDNIGRTIAEYPHLAEIGAARRCGRIEVVGGEHIQAMREDGVAGILVGGHLANWEVFPAVTRASGLELALIYRPPNNPFVHPLLLRLRGAASRIHLPKGARGARALVAHLAQGGHAGMLIDQKFNEGVPVPFFGRDAMTAPALAQLGRRFGIPLHPVRTERLDGARFRVTILPPIEQADTGDKRADSARTLLRFNALLEGWVRERPADWLWLHRRWPDAVSPGAP